MNITTLFALIGVAIFCLFWSASRVAAENARLAGRDACRRAGVQWLDQNVSLLKLSLRRDDQGRLRILRQYSFDYSRNGSDRQRGMLAMLGNELQWITEPETSDNRIDGS